MRQISLLLCLLVFAALGGIIRSNRAGTTEQDDMVLSRTQIVPKAVNTVFTAGSIAATSTHAQDASRTLHRQPGTVIARTLPSARTIHPLSQSNQLVKFEFTELRIGDIIETLSPASDRV